MNGNQDHFNVLRKIKNKPQSTQRELVQELGFSLGKLNYCLKALKAKGLIKINSFKKILKNLIIFTFLSLKKLVKKPNFNKFYEKEDSRIRRAEKRN